MNAEQIGTVSIAVIGLTQLVKWSGLPARLSPLAVFILSALGVGLWGWSVGTFERTQAFSYFAAWVLVSTSAAGVFGFLREGAEGVTALRRTPPVVVLAIALGLSTVVAGCAARTLPPTASLEARLAVQGREVVGATRAVVEATNTLVSSAVISRDQGLQVLDVVDRVATGASRLVDVLRILDATTGDERLALGSQARTLLTSIERTVADLPAGPRARMTSAVDRLVGAIAAIAASLPPPAPVTP